MTATYTLREYGELQVGSTSDLRNGCLSEGQADHLQSLSRRYRADIFKRTGKSVVKAQQFVGVVQTNTMAIEVLPKIDGLTDDGDVRKNLVMMLARTRNLDIREGEVANLAIQHNVLEVVIRLFINRLFAEVHRGLIHRYETREENLPLLRGRLHTTRHAVLNAAHPERFLCRFEEFQGDHPLNQALKAAVALLRRVSLNEENLRCLSELQFALDDVTTLSPGSVPWERISLDRTNVRFHTLIALARIFLRGDAQDVSRGEKVGFSLLFDMNKLFEEYIGRIVVESQRGTGVVVTLQSPEQYLLEDTATGRGAFLAQPDVVARKSGLSQWIIDTKWKLLDPAETYASVAQADIYQMMGYAHRYGCPDIMLLYPHVSRLGRPGTQRTYRLLGPPTDAQQSAVPMNIRVCTVALENLASVEMQVRRLIPLGDGEQHGGRDITLGRAMA
ncbi:MAG: restriction endonuclease [Casimicrobiaceae bacterium]